MDEERWRSLHQVTSCVPVQKEKKNLCRTEALQDSEFMSTQNSEFFRFSMADKSEKLRVKPLAQKGK